MEGPKRIYLFPGIASGYESRTFPDEIEYTRADLTDALVKAAEKVVLAIDEAQIVWILDAGKKLKAALAAHRGEVNE